MACLFLFFCSFSPSSYVLFFFLLSLLLVGRDCSRCRCGRGRTEIAGVLYVSMVVLMIAVDVNVFVAVVAAAAAVNMVVAAAVFIFCCSRVYSVVA